MCLCRCREKAEKSTKENPRGVEGSKDANRRTEPKPTEPTQGQGSPAGWEVGVLRTRERDGSLVLV